MAALSRRRLAQYAAQQLAAGNANLPAQLAAYLVQHTQAKQADLLVAEIVHELEKSGRLSAATVTTASPLSDTQRHSIRDYLQKQVAVDAVELTEQVDPTLIGGVIVQTADAVYDRSVKTQLNNLTKA